MLKLIMALSKINKISNIHPVEKIILSMFPIIAIGFCQKSIPIIFNIIVFIILHLVCKNNKKIVIKFTLGITAFAAFSSIRNKNLSMLFAISHISLSQLYFENISKTSSTGVVKEKNDKHNPADKLLSKIIPQYSNP